jgi:hypothetical protein
MVQPLHSLTQPLTRSIGHTCHVVGTKLETLQPRSTRELLRIDAASQATNLFVLYSLVLTYIVSLNCGMYFVTGCVSLIYSLCAGL